MQADNEKHNKKHGQALPKTINRIRKSLASTAVIASGNFSYAKLQETHKTKHLLGLPVREIEAKI